jgi:hypothetical protein
VRIAGLDRTLRTIFRGVLEVIQVRDDLSGELENSDDAGYSVESIHGGRCRIPMADMCERETSCEEGSMMIENFTRVTRVRLQ